MDEFKRVRSVTDRESGQTYIIGLKSGRIFSRRYILGHFLGKKPRPYPTSGLLFSQLLGFLQNKERVYDEEYCAMSKLS